MGDLSIFLQQNWLLLLAGLVVVLFLLYEEKNSTSDTLRLSPERAVSLINNEDAKILDLREKSIYKEVHIAGSLNIPFQEFKPDHKRLNHAKDNPLIIIATSRSEGIRALSQLKKSGKKEVYFMPGGLNAWKEANMPVSGR